MFCYFFGHRYHSQCSDVAMCGNSIKFVSSTKVLSIQLSAYKNSYRYKLYEVLSFIVLLMACFVTQQNQKMKL